MKLPAATIAVLSTVLAACGTEVVPAMPGSPDESRMTPSESFSLTLPYTVNGLIYGYQGCSGTFVKAAELQPGMIIKGSEPLLFYYASNNKRYRFPLIRDLASWFGALSDEGLPLQEDDPSICGIAVEIPDEVLDEIPIGGNVTIRPGTYVVALVASPTRYVIGRGHALHRISAEVGEAVYPETFHGRTRFLPDAFFVNYVGGSDITEPGQYDPDEERTTATIEMDGLSP